MGATSPIRAMAAPALAVVTKRVLSGATRSDWASQLNTPFHIHSATKGKIKVTLAEVKMGQAAALKPGQLPRPDAGNERFSLIFSGCRSELLAQDTYRMDHPALGQFELFIVPIFTRNLSKIDYQAVVNRPRPRNLDTLKQNKIEG